MPLWRPVFSMIGVLPGVVGEWGLVCYSSYAQSGVISLFDILHHPLFHFPVLDALLTSSIFDKPVFMIGACTSANIRAERRNHVSPDLIIS